MNKFEEIFYTHIHACMRATADLVRGCVSARVSAGPLALSRITVKATPYFTDTGQYKKCGQHGQAGFDIHQLLLAQGKTQEAQATLYFAGLCLCWGKTQWEKQVKFCRIVN